MRISFQRTGGFAGISRTTTVDTNDLPEQEAEQVPQMVQAADFFNLPSQISDSTSQFDRFQYKLTVEEQGKSHSITVSEAAIPENLRPLIEWLTTHPHQ